MRIQKLLEHYGIRGNPFLEEDAKTDTVFRDKCVDSVYHPAWEKIYGDPAAPATSIVFGEKGSGKTALKIQIKNLLDEIDESDEKRKIFVLEYDDFNPFLDRFRETIELEQSQHSLFRFGKRSKGNIFEDWQLWHHMDSILAIGVTKLLDKLSDEKLDRQQSPSKDFQISRLNRYQSRDLLLLSALYDQSSQSTSLARWSQLQQRLHYRTWASYRNHALGVAGSLLTIFTVVKIEGGSLLVTPWPYLALVFVWLPLLANIFRNHRLSKRLRRQLKTIKHSPSTLRKILCRFAPVDLADQPLPMENQTNERYALLGKLQDLLNTFGYRGLVVLIDRVDEPHLINGAPEKMKQFLWPMLDNKFLKHPGVGFKMMLPIELRYMIDKEGSDFYERSRLDKQNVVRSLKWTGVALYDMANARIRACAQENTNPALIDLFDESVSHARLIDAFATLRVPRHLFKFLYRLLSDHCEVFSEEEPRWHISEVTFEKILSHYQEELSAFDRGMGVP